MKQQAHVNSKRSNSAHCIPHSYTHMAPPLSACTVRVPPRRQLGEAWRRRTGIPSSGLPTILPSVMSTTTEQAANSAPDPTPNDKRLARSPSTAPAANPPNTPFQASFLPAQAASRLVSHKQRGHAVLLTFILMALGYLAKLAD